MKWYEIALLLLIIPVGAYLREIAYKPYKLIEDVLDLLQRLFLNDRGNKKRN